MKAIHIKSSLIAESLDAKPVQGKRMLEPLSAFAKENTVPLGLLEDTEVSNDAEVHIKAGDLWQCIEGEVTFICGGELEAPEFRKNLDGTDNPNELFAKSIKSGETFLLKKGDWLWIPSGEPHQHSTSTTARLFIIKVPG